MSRCERCDREACPSQGPAANDDGCFWPDCHREACASCAAQNDCDRHRVDWRARYLALRDAVREEREADETYRTASRFIGGEEADARHDEHQQARAAVDRILDEGGSK